MASMVPITESASPPEVNRVQNPLHALRSGSNPLSPKARVAPPRVMSFASVVKERKADSTMWNGVLLEGGLPVREGLQTLYKIVRDKAIREALVFMVFAFMFITIVYQVHDVHEAFSQNNGLMDLFLDEEFEDATYKKNFNEIMTFGESWTWLQGPVYNGLYPDEWYNGQPFTPDEEGYVLMYMRVIGGAQLRQARVSNESCAIRRFLNLCITDEATGVCVPQYDSKDGTCFSEFSVSRQMTDDYGPGGPGFVWSGGHSDLQGWFGFGPNYGDGGYIAPLSLNRTTAKATLNRLESDLWIDRGTRVVAVNFNMYNTNSRQVSVVRMQLEFFATSLVVRSFRFVTFRIAVYSARLDKVRVVLEIAFVAFWAYYVQKEVRRVYHRTAPRILYFADFRNCFEAFTLVVALIIMLQWISFVTNPLRSSFDVNAEEYVDMYQFASSYSDALSLAGFYTLLLFLKFFRYLGISKRMNALWFTLRSASSDIAAFVVGFMAVVTGFGYTAMMVFGFVLVDFHSFTSSVSTLMRFPLGDFDYKDLQRARPAIASIFFGSFMAIVFFVLFNVFVAIVTNHFDQVHRALLRMDQWKESSMSWEAVQLQRFARMFRKLKACLKRSTGRGRSPSRLQRMQALGTVPSVDEEEEDDDDDAKVGKMDQLAAVGLEVQEEWEKLLHRCMRQAKRLHAIDLQRYLEKIHLGANGRQLYLGLDELCYLTKETPCPPGEHLECLAACSLAKYHKVKDVLILGNVEEHTNILFGTAGMARFPVVKINKSGRKQKRVMVIDPAGFILNFTKAMSLNKRLALSQLVQIEYSTSNKCRVRLVFSSDGLPSAPTNAQYETSYTLILPSRQQKAAFISALLAAGAKSSKNSAAAAMDPDPDVPEPPKTGRSARRSVYAQASSEARRQKAKAGGGVLGRLQGPRGSASPAAAVDPALLSTLAMLEKSVGSLQRLLADS